MRIAVCPGSFDPVTLGHIDVIRRARSMFDRVLVVVAVNAGKTPLFSLDTRVALVQDAVAGLDGVEVVAVPGLLADFLASSGACAVVKGVRGSADIAAEVPMALMNRHLSQVETIFVAADPTLSHISSSLVKDVARHHGPVDDLVSAAVRDELHTAFGLER